MISQVDDDDDDDEERGDHRLIEMATKMERGKDLINFSK